MVEFKDPKCCLRAETFLRTRAKLPSLMSHFVVDFSQEHAAKPSFGKFGSSGASVNKMLQTSALLHIFHTQLRFDSSILVLRLSWFVSLD